jgi:NADH-quinone oxidoreductase subunit C
MTIELDTQIISDHINEFFDDDVFDIPEGNVVYIKPGSLREVCSFLKDDPFMDMQMLRYVDAVDFIDRFELRYALLSLNKNHSMTFKVRLWGREDLSAESVVNIWAGANLQEREIYDLMGISFAGHPNMKRVFLWEGFPGHPLRKDFP